MHTPLFILGEDWLIVHLRVRGYAECRLLTQSVPHGDLIFIDLVNLEDSI